jgi:hypothetical protein
MRGLALSLVALPLVSCTGTTGYQLVSFYAVAKGADDAQLGQPYVFASGSFQVSLTRAVLHVGAVYLDQSLPTAGSAEGTCTLPGTYVGQVRGGLDVDMLDPRPQPFPVYGDGSTIPAAVGQVWLSGPDVTSTGQQTAPQSVLPDVLEIAGTAAKDGTTIAFAGAISIESTGSSTTASSALPGSNPICEQRIVSKILVDITLAQSGTLILHLDPKALFTNVDFSALPPVSSDPPSFAFTNKGSSDSDQPSRNLYANLRASGPVYRFEWQPATP